jgi:hypothetical protein
VRRGGKERLTRSLTVNETRGLLDETCATCASGSPALMYFMWPATHTTKLPSGRPSTSCLRLRSYSEAGIPGVTSPCLTVCAHTHTHPCIRWSANDFRRNDKSHHTPAPTATVGGGERRGAAHRGGGGISRWAGQRRRASWLVDGAGALVHELAWHMMRRVVNFDGKREKRGDIAQSKVGGKK